MAQRGTGFARKPPAQEAPRVEAPPRPLPEEPIPPEPIALDFAPLIAPYRRHGRLAVRVERMPSRARLSRGHINSDRSWSLALDEIDGLTYMPASVADAAPTLALRLIRLDGGDGGTLALLDYAVAPEENAVVSEAPSDGKELRKLRDELAKLKTSLTIREAELARVKEETAPASVELPREAIDVELAALRETWEGETQTRIADAVKEATETLTKLRGAVRASEDSRLAKLEKSIEERLSQERERWQKDADNALRKAEADWKAAESARLAAAETAWQKRSEKAFAEAAAQLEKTKIPPVGETARARADESEKRKLREDLAKANATLAEREAELERERAAAKRTRDEAGKLRDADGERQRLRDELSSTKKALSERDAELERERSHVKETRFEAGKLRDADTERQHLRNELAKSRSLLIEREKELAHARDAATKRDDAEIIAARLGSDLDKAKVALAATQAELKELRSGADQARNEADNLRGDSVELKRIRGELATAKTSLATHEAELARAQRSHEEALRRAERDADKALKDAESRWKEEEARRSAAAEAKWRKQSDEAIARLEDKNENSEDRVREEAARRKSVEEVLADARDAQAALKTLLSARDEELTQLKIGHEQARAVWAQDTETALSKAQQAWKVGEAARAAALEGQLLGQTATTLSDMTERAKKAESVLAETRAQNEALRHRGDTADFLRLRKELGSVQGALARRESELMQLRSDHELERERLAAQARAAVQKADEQWREQETESEDHQERALATRRLIRNLVAAVAFGGLAMVGYYKVAPMITDTGVLDPILAQNDIHPTATATAPAAAIQRPALSVLYAAKLRAGPSTSSSIIGSLPVGAQVIALERQDKWVKVEVQARVNEVTQQGWVHGSVLSKLVPDTKPASSVPGK